MLAEIITIGDELLIGQTIDTNSAWIGEQLSLLGIRVNQITSITDQETHIIGALDEANKRAKLIIITGGLGPTKDDITKHTLCKYFETKLVMNSEVLDFLKERYEKFNLNFTKINQDQALLPESSITLRNTRGSASGMWFEKEGIVYISLPGVPYEMKGILTDEGFPKLIKHFNTPNVIHKTVRTIGVTESKLSHILENWENNLSLDELKLAYLPSPGFVRLRISGIDNNNKLKPIINDHINSLHKLIGEHIYGEEKETLEQIIGKLLTEQNKTLSVAESCTGGNIAKIVTQVSGSSAYFKGGIVSYDNEVKINLLEVKQEDIVNHGAVSEVVVKQMALKVRELLKTDFSISTSGIAGPTGGSEEKPIGTVWIAIASSNKIVTKKLLLPFNNRERNISVASNFALNELRKHFLI